MHVFQLVYGVDEWGFGDRVELVLAEQGHLDCGGHVFESVSLDCGDFVRVETDFSQSFCDIVIYENLCKYKFYEYI